MEYGKHLYQILHPNNSLVASQLGPEDFAMHYQVGSSRFYKGKVIFNEIDIDYRHDFFNIDKGLNGLIPHDDGRPKATKYIGSYRVLEHLDFKAMKSLYLVTVNGKTLELKPGEHDKPHEPGFIRTYAQISPTTVLSMSQLNPVEYAQYITRPGHSKWVPKLFFTQIEFTVDQFLKDFEENPFMNPPFPFVHPAKIRDSILEIRETNKESKGVSLKSDLEKIPYTKIRHGFWITSETNSIFYPMPDEHTIKADYYDFYKDMYK